MEAIILAGLQGAGKSTYCRDHYWDSHIRINYDMLRTRHRERLLLMACIEAKQPFVIDSTNPTAQDREQYIQPAKAAKFKIIGIEFQISADLAVTRNAGRFRKKPVPETAIYMTAAKFQPLTFSEGFDEIWRVTVTPEGMKREKFYEI